MAKRNKVKQAKKNGKMKLREQILAAITEENCKKELTLKIDASDDDQGKNYKDFEGLFIDLPHIGDDSYISFDVEALYTISYEGSSYDNPGWDDSEITDIEIKNLLIVVDDLTISKTDEWFYNQVEKAIREILTVQFA